MKCYACMMDRRKEERKGKGRGKGGTGLGSHFAAVFFVYCQCIMVDGVFGFDLICKGWVFSLEL